MPHVESTTKRQANGQGGRVGRVIGLFFGKKGNLLGDFSFYVEIIPFYIVTHRHKYDEEEAEECM